MHKRCPIKNNLIKTTAHFIRAEKKAMAPKKAPKVLISIVEKNTLLDSMKQYTFFIIL